MVIDDGDITGYFDGMRNMNHKCGFVSTYNL